jgi:hypothetical protein
MPFMFYSTVSNPSALADVEYPCATVIGDNWDDFGYKTVESRSGAVTDVPFPLPARRTGQAVFPHPALGQESALLKRVTD